MKVAFTSTSPPSTVKVLPDFVETGLAVSASNCVAFPSLSLTVHVYVYLVPAVSISAPFWNSLAVRTVEPVPFLNTSPAED